MSDCLIVGAGVIGLSLAYELARCDLSVKVIDRAAPGKEASWAGAGILPPANMQTAAHPWDQLRAMSHQLHRKWAEMLREETGVDTGFRRCGGIYLARSSGEAASLLGYCAQLKERQIEVQRLTPDALVALEPVLQSLAESGSIKIALSLPDEAQLRNPDHLRALQLACQSRGVEVCANVAAERFDVAGGRLQSVATNAGKLSAQSYCITSGAWTQKLLEQLGIANGIMPIRGQMVLFACRERVFSRVINEGPRYLVPRDDGLVLVGSTEEEVGFDKNTTAEAVAELTELARELVPPLRDIQPLRSWAGLRPGSYDGFPYIGPVPGLDNTFVAAGHYRSGLHLSPGTAVVLSRLVRGEDPQIDLAPFRVGRG